MVTRYSKGQTVNYKTTGAFHSSGEIVSIKQEMLNGKLENIYLVSEGNGGQSMVYVSESNILTLLTG